MVVSFQGFRAFRLLAVLATIASMGVVAIEPTLRRETPARLGRLVAVPVDPLPDAPERGPQEEEPLSGPADDTLPESIKVARWESLPRRGAKDAPGHAGPPPAVAAIAAGTPISRRIDPAHHGRTRLCTRLCRLTC